MSERFQKTFISIREFVESWDKELYELNNLDFFIYLLINHVGNQLEKRYFIQDKKHSTLYLDFDNLGTVCFNLGDALEFYLEDNCLGTCPLNCPRDLDESVDLARSDIEERIKKKLNLLQSFMSGQLDKEQCLRIDLMNHVILDTLIQFYRDEFDMEITEDDLLLLELGEFIENTIIDFIRLEGQTLLFRPFDTAIDYFEDLLQSEADEEQKNNWSEEDTAWEEAQDFEVWQENTETIDDVFARFLSDTHYNPADAGSALVYDIDFFKRYLKEYAEVVTISELNEHHVAEFFSVWLAREFVMLDEKQVSFVFRATARFITFLYHQYHINLKRDFLRFYERLKLDLPRVIKATNTFISEYNLLEVLLTNEQQDDPEKSGYFEIIGIHNHSSSLMDLRETHFLEVFEQVRMDSSIFNKLKKGDILHASIIKKSHSWEILDIQYVYPSLAKRYVH